MSTTRDLCGSLQPRLGRLFLHLIDFPAWSVPSITSPHLVFFFFVAIMPLFISSKWNKTAPIYTALLVYLTKLPRRSVLLPRLVSADCP